MSKTSQRKLTIWSKSILDYHQWIGRKRNQRLHSPLLFILCLMLVRCEAAPPSSHQLTKSQEIGSDRVTTVLIDACVQENTLNGPDYYITSESRAGANALLQATLKLLPGNVRIGPKLVPFVCGARHDAGNRPLKVADHINGVVTEAPQPFDVSSEVTSDPDYLNALTVASTYMFEHSPRVTKENGGNTTDSKTPAAQGIVPEEAFRDALSVIADRNHTSTLLYIGVSGVSLSSEKATALGAGRFAVGMATAILTAGILRTAYIGVIPGQVTDGRIMAASLVDLQTRKVVRSNAVRAGGDPVKPEVMADTESLEVLLRGAIFQPDPAPKTQ